MAIASPRVCALIHLTVLAACADRPADTDADAGDTTSMPAGSSGDAQGDTTVADADTGIASDTGPASSGGADDGETSSSGGGDEPLGCSPRTPPLELPAAAWTAVADGLATTASQCTEVAAIAAQPCSARVAIGLENHGVWASDDGGASWAPLGGGPGSASIDHRPMALVFDPSDPTTMWSAGIYGSAGIYVTHDDGEGFASLGTMTFSQLIAVDFADPLRRTLVVGTHGQPQQVHLSADGGASWTNIGVNLPADTHNAESPLVLDDHTFLVGACGYGDGVCGIHRSTDAGASWTKVSELPPSHFGGPLRASDGALYWPLFGEGGLAKSTDDGLSWTTAVTGTVLGVTPLELPDGSLATLSATAVVRSTDGGASWQPVTDAFAPLGSSLDAAVTYSAGAQAFFVVRRDCGTAVADAIQRAGFASP